MCHAVSRVTGRRVTTSCSVIAGYLPPDISISLYLYLLQFGSHFCFSASDVEIGNASYPFMNWDETQNNIMNEYWHEYWHDAWSFDNMYFFRHFFALVLIQTCTFKERDSKIHPRGIFAIPRKVAFWTPDCVTFQWGKGAICIFCRTHCNMWSMRAKVRTARPGTGLDRNSKSFDQDIASFPTFYSFYSRAVITY